MAHAKTRTRHLMTGAMLSALVASGAFAQTSEVNINDFTLPTFSEEAAGASAGGTNTAAAGDNLGNHVATETVRLSFGALVDNGASIALTGGGSIILDGGKVSGVGAPVTDTDAANKLYVDQAITNANMTGDNLGDHVATRSVDMSGNRVINLANPSSGGDAVNRDYLQAYVANNSGDNLGSHLATRDVDFDNFRLINVPPPINNTDAANKIYVDQQIANIGGGAGGGGGNGGGNTSSTRILAGTGLTGGGQLNQDRTLSFDTAYGDGRYALRARTLTAGDGLTGGGSLSGNLSFAVDGSVVRTKGTQTVSGNKTFSGGINMLNTRITNLALPISATDAASKAYVDAFVGGGNVVGDNLGNHTMTAQLQGLPSDGPGTPSYSWRLDTDTGMYRIAADTIAFTTAGVQRFTLGTSAADFDVPIIADSDTITIRSNGNKFLWYREQNNTPRAVSYFNDASNGNTGALIHQVYNTGGTFTGGMGIYVTGAITPVGNGFWSGNGNGLTNLNANNINAGTLNEARLQDNYRRRLGGQGNPGFVVYNGTSRANGAFYGGNVNPTNTGNRLNYNGVMYATRFYSQIYLYHSDARLKHDITDMADGQTENVLQLQPKTFTWNNNGEEAMGFIAQDIEKIFPLMVKTDENGMKSVDYAQMISPLVKTIQEMNARLEVLEAAQ